jgi:hypothetical protein
MLKVTTVGRYWEAQAKMVLFSFRFLAAFSIWERWGQMKYIARARRKK